MTDEAGVVHQTLIIFAYVFGKATDFDITVHL